MAGAYLPLLAMIVLHGAALWLGCLVRLRAALAAFLGGQLVGAVWLLVEAPRPSAALIPAAAGCAIAAALLRMLWQAWQRRRGGGR